ncbi:MAG: hypothetical protein V1754_15870, partial [Pseudomonadota bacterium]
VSFGIAKASLQVRRVLFVVVGIMASSWATVVAIRSADFTDDLRMWRATAASSPQNPLAEQMVASALVRRGEYREAEKWLARSYLDWIRVRSSRDVLKIQFAWLDLHLLRVPDRDTVFLRQAEVFLEKLIQMAHSAPGSNQRAEILIGKITLFVSVKKEETKKQLRVKLPFLHSLLGTVQSRLGKDQNAVQNYARSLEKSPNHEGTMMNLALAYARSLEIEKAKIQLGRVFDQVTDSADAKKLARTLDRVAIKIMQMKSTKPPLENAQIQAERHRTLAEIYILLHAPMRVKKHLEEVIRLTPDDRGAYSMLALELAAMQDLDGALVVLKKALQHFGPEPGLENLERQVHSVYKSSLSKHNDQESGKSTKK